jgi:hypothetical protein
MSKATPLELFAVFAAQLPLLTRKDLEAVLEDLRESPGWARAMSHARLQAEAIGLREELESAPEIAVLDPDPSAESVVGSA